MSNVSKRRKECSRAKIKSVGDHKEFLKRITKTLYYGELPTLPCLSLPVTEISCEAWSMAQRGRSLRRLHADAAADIARQACVSPCALVLAILYLERLHSANPDYLAATPPADLFLVSLMVGNKFLQDDGEDDEVICSEWAASGGIDLKQLKRLEVEFLSAIDWNVFVSTKSFETGLRRLERRVALRQAAARGYFTYADLAAATAGAEDSLLASVARGVGAGWLAAASAYLASLAALLALLASALLLARAASSARPAPGPAYPANATTRAPAPDSPDAPLAAPDAPLDAFESLLNAALTAPDALLDAPDALLDAPDAADALLDGRPLCCASWARHPSATAGRRPGGAGDPEAGWSATAALDWVSRSAALGPLRRWLERLSEYGALARRLAALAGADSPPERGASRAAPVRPRCLRRWLDLGKLGAVVAVSDR